MAGTPRWALRAMFAVSGVGMWRSNEAAVLCLQRPGSVGPTVRQVAPLVGLVVVEAGLLVAGGPGRAAAGVLLLAVLVWAVALLPVSVRAARVSGLDRRLRRALPAEAWLVHTVASRRSGAGRELLQAVGVEADRDGRRLGLVAANDRLADYYRDLGYVAVGEPAVMPWGERSVAMVRPSAGEKIEGRPLPAHSGEVISN